MAIKNAREIFCPPDFTPEEIKRIWAKAAGKTLYFPCDTSSTPSSDLTPYLLLYARGENWRHNLPVSRRRFYQKLKAVRQNLTPENVAYFQDRGLTLHQLARLFGVSIPTIQRIKKEA